MWGMDEDECQKVPVIYDSLDSEVIILFTSFYIISSIYLNLRLQNLSSIIVRDPLCFFKGHDASFFRFNL